MGWLRKKFKQVKNAVKKVFKGVKKVVKKITKSKLFKVIATVGAVLATGGAALGAFGGSFASSAFGQAIIKGGQFFAKFNPTSFKPFTATGKFLGSTLGKVTDFTGLTSEAGREAGRMGYKFDSELGRYVAPDTVQATDVGKIVDVKAGKTLELSELAAKTGEAAAKTVDTTSKLARGTVLGDVTRGVITNVGTGMAMQKMQGDPDKVGVATGLNLEGDTRLSDLAVAYSEANVRSLEDVYKTNYFGTADVGFNTNEPLFQQETLKIS